MSENTKEIKQVLLSLPLEVYNRIQSTQKRKNEILFIDVIKGYILNGLLRDERYFNLVDYCAEHNIDILKYDKEKEEKDKQQEEFIKEKLGCQFLRIKDFERGRK